MQDINNVRQNLLDIIKQLKQLITNGKMRYSQIPFNDIKEYFINGFEINNSEIRDKFDEVFKELEENITVENIDRCLNYISLIASIAPIREEEAISSYSEKNFSQCGEQVYFTSAGFGSGKKGTYVDIGAHHPFRYSNTFWAYAEGWRGVNIEPNEEMIKLFEAFRSEDINVCCGVGDEKGAIDYYKFIDPAYNTFDEEQAKEYIAQGVPLVEKKKVDVLPLGDILEKTQIKDIDIMSIDVEGLEIKVLKSNDWNKYLPKHILIEQKVDSITEIEKTEEYKYLVDKGYECVSYYRVTAVYKLKEQ